MKNKLTNPILIISSLALIVGLGACTAKYCSDKPEKQVAWLTEKATDKLDLNDAQQAKFKLFSQSLVNTRQSLKNNKSQTHQELLAMMQQPKLERQRTQAMINEHIAKLQSYTPALVKNFGDFFDTLTAEQRKKLQDELDDHFDHHHRKHHW